MKAATIKQRTLEKFIMSEFIQGNLNTQEEVASMLILIQYLQPIITQYFIDNKSEIWLLFLIAHSKR